LLLFEQPVHVSREFEQPDTSVHVLAVSGPESVDLSLNPRLLLPILARLSFEQGKVDSAVEPVFVHDIQAVLQPSVFLLELSYRFVSEALLVPVALAERGGDPVHDLFVNRDAPKHGSVGFLQRLLTDIGLATFPARARAVVVNVFPLLDFADHCEPT
jgi:hypothetical protein